MVRASVCIAQVSTARYASFQHQATVCLLQVAVDHGATAVWWLEAAAARLHRDEGPLLASSELGEHARWAAQHRHGDTVTLPPGQPARRPWLPSPAPVYVANVAGQTDSVSATLPAQHSFKLKRCHWQALAAAATLWQMLHGLKSQHWLCRREPRESAA